MTTLQIPSHSFYRVLFNASTAYLALPLLIFIVGYLRWAWAIPFVASLIAVCGYLWRHAQAIFPPSFTRPAPTVTQLLALTLLILIVMTTTGMGGVGAQDADWAKHNAMLYTLMTQPWPVKLSYEGTSLALVYYTAFLLPAAVVGKVLGWTGANGFLFIWGMFGLLLSVLWFCAVARDFSLLPALFLLFFSAPDFIGKLLSPFTFGSIEWWMPPWRFSFSTMLINNVPNQAMPAWIIASLGVLILEEHSSIRFFLFFLALTALWSPFITLGLVPFACAALVWCHPVKLKTYLNLPNGIGTVMLGLCGVYYAAKLSVSSPFPIEIPPELEGLGLGLPGFRLIYTTADGLTDLLLLLLKLLAFLTLEIGLFAFFLVACSKHRPVLFRGLLWTSLFTLLLVVQFRFGYFNDFVMRVSIPAVFFISVLVYATLRKQTCERKWLHYGLLLTIGIGALNPAVSYYRHLYVNRPAHLFVLPEPHTLQEAFPPEIPPNRTLYFQYMGNPNSFFFDTLAKPHPQTSP